MLAFSCLTEPTKIRKIASQSGQHSSNYRRFIQKN